MARISRLMILWASASRSSAPNATTSVLTTVQFWPVSSGVRGGGTRAPGLLARFTTHPFAGSLARS